ncbi:hypothetical protein B0H14DRAFT_1480769 [Mycena olivaceomarginata]|nr:hypothetical protein B0H14DRAFT_1480769 [Mycena olivaceomarginata]
MDILPLELLHTIAQDVRGHSDIRNLRLVSKSLNSVATPLAFRVIVVHDSVKSANAVSFLQSCDESITSLVHEVVFRGDPEGSVELAGEAETSGEAGREALRIVFSGLNRFCNLQNLRLDFHDNYEEWDEPTHYLLLQKDIFTALASSPPPLLASLALIDMIAVPDDIYAQEDFHRVFRSLKTLEISVLCNADLEGVYCDEVLGEFWDQSVPHMVRSATAVTALTIRSDLRVGALPAMTFDMFLPHLSSLVLHKFVLHDAVEFILDHKATLTRLELHDCSIDGGLEGDIPRPWHAVFALFEAELGALRDFVFESESDWRFEYTREDPGFGHVPFDDPEEDAEFLGKGLDGPALESLVAVVESRRRGRHTDDVQITTFQG